MGSLDAMRRDLIRKTSQAAQLTASDWESRLRRETPTDTGNMRQRTTVRARTTATGATILAKVDTPYAHIVAGGQRPHLITEAKPGKFLHNVRTGFEADVASQPPRRDGPHMVGRRTQGRARPVGP